MNVNQTTARVKEFRRQTKQTVPAGLDLDSTDVQIAFALVDKHLDDVSAALRADEVTAVTEYGHLLFVVWNLGVAMGVPISEVLNIVIASNESRALEPSFDDDGRVLKGPNFIPPEPGVKRLLQEIGLIRG